MKWFTVETSLMSIVCRSFIIISHIISDFETQTMFFVDQAFHQ